MDLQTRKLQLIQDFIKIQSEEVILKIESILKKAENISESEDFNPMTIEEFNSRIDQSLADSEKGRMIEATELKAKIDKWS